MTGVTRPIDGEYLEFHSRLAHLMDDQGWTTSSLAFATGISRPCINGWTRGANCPNMDSVRRLAAAFKLTPLGVLWLIGLEPVEDEGVTTDQQGPTQSKA